MPACKFLNVHSKAECKENFSGVGSTLYLFQIDDENKPNAKTFYDDEKAICTLPSSGIKFYEIKIKPKSGKVDYTINSNGGGFTNTMTALVAQNMDDMSALLRSMNNSDNWGVLVGAGNNEYYVLYDPEFNPELGGNGTTGDAPDSDHGHTLEISCGPMKYPLCKTTLESIKVEADA